MHCEVIGVYGRFHALKSGISISTDTSREGETGYSSVSCMEERLGG